MWIVYYYHLQLGNYSYPYAIIVGNFYVCIGNILGWILLMCALRAHNSKPILEKVYWELKKF